MKRRNAENLVILAAALICILLVFAARHHSPSRRKIKEIWHGRVYWEENTTMLRSSTVEEIATKKADVKSEVAISDSRNPELTTSNTMIPKIIHQYWNGKNPPKGLMQHCRDLHPDWEYHLWTPENVGEIPDFLNVDIFNAFSHQQVNGQSDIVRFEVLRTYGGIYLDADTVCFRSLEPLRKNGFFASYVNKGNSGSRDNSPENSRYKLIASSVIGSIKNHPLSQKLVVTLENNIRHANGQAWRTVGPGLLTRTIDSCTQCNSSSDIHIYPFWAFVPYHLSEKRIIMSYMHRLSELPKVRKYNSFAMNLWGTTFNNWNQLSAINLETKNELSAINLETKNACSNMLSDKKTTFSFDNDIINVVPEGQHIINWISRVEKKFCKIWKRETEKCQKHKDRLVLDIGANHGIYGIWAATKGCDVYMFEPQPTCHRHIQKNICLNTYPLQSPILIDQPILESTSMSIHVHDDSNCAGTFGAYGSLEKATLNGKKVFGVDALKIIGEKEIQILKIDVEGGELGVLTHLMPLFKKRQVHNAVIEFTTRFWKQKNIKRATAWKTIKQIYRSGYDVHVVECIHPDIHLGGTTFLSENDFKNFIVSKKWLQCDFFFGRKVNNNVQKKTHQHFVISGQYIEYKSPVLQDKDILIGILSIRAHVELRNAIRNTWGKSNDILFIIGGKYEDIKDEYVKFNDIFWIDVDEHYNKNGMSSSLTFKTQSFIMYSKTVNAKYVLKTDDDSYVYMKKLKDEINRLKPDYWGNGLWSGHNVQRSGKYKIASTQYVHSKLPVYASGAGYVLSNAFVRCASEMIPSIKTISMEDVSVGVLAEKCNIKLISDDGVITPGYGKSISDEKNVIRHWVKTKEEMVRLYNSEISKTSVIKKVGNTPKDKVLQKQQVKNTMTDAMQNTFEVSPKMDIENTVRIQHRLLYMLTHFIRIAEKYDIKYWLCGGTLIGAIRHKGFVPWDTDIDISISFDSYTIFKSVADQELPKDLWLQDTQSDPFYKVARMFKIRDLNSDYETWSKNHKDWHNGIQVDLFIWDEGKQCAFSGHNTCCAPNKLVYPLKTVPFENITVNIPQKDTEILNGFFGNLDIPPVSKRLNHEGKATFFAPDWVKNKYPYLYSTKKYSETSEQVENTPTARLRNVYLVQGVAENYLKWTQRIYNMDKNAILLYLSFDKDCEGCIFDPDIDYVAGYNSLLRRAVNIIDVKFIITSDGDLEMGCEQGGFFSKSEICWKHWNTFVLNQDKEWYISPLTWHNPIGEASLHETCTEVGLVAVRRDKIHLIYPLPEYNVEKSWWLNIQIRWRVGKACFPNEFFSTDRFRIYNSVSLPYPRGLTLVDVIDILKNDYRALKLDTTDKKNLKHRCKIKKTHTKNCDKALQQRYDLWFRENKLPRNYKETQQLLEIHKENHFTGLSSDNRFQIYPELQYSQVVKETFDALNTLDTNWWVVEGTLAGALRWGNNIGFTSKNIALTDTDIDVMIEIKDEEDWIRMKKTLKTNFLKNVHSYNWRWTECNSYNHNIAPIRKYPKFKCKTSVSSFSGSGTKGMTGSVHLDLHSYFVSQKLNKIATDPACFRNPSLCKKKWPFQYWGGIAPYRGLIVNTNGQFSKVKYGSQVVRAAFDSVKLISAWNNGEYSSKMHNTNKNGNEHFPYNEYCIFGTLKAPTLKQVSKDKSPETALTLCKKSLELHQNGFASWYSKFSKDCIEEEKNAITYVKQTDRCKLYSERQCDSKKSYECPKIDNDDYLQSK